jgi:hypothetical protein
MTHGLVTKRRRGENLRFVVDGQVVATLKLVEVGAGEAAFKLSVAALGFEVGIGLKTAANGASVQISAPRQLLGVVRGEIMQDELREGFAAYRVAGPHR